MQPNPAAGPRYRKTVVLGSGKECQGVHRHGIWNIMGINHRDRAGFGGPWRLLQVRSEMEVALDTRLPYERC